MMMHKRLMMMICLVATLALAACGDDSGNNGNNNGGGNNGADAGNQDAGDQDAGDQDGGDQDGGDQDGGDQDGGNDADASGSGGCDLTGFAAPADLQIEESAGSWSVFGESGDQLFQVTFIKEGGATGTGTFEIEDVAIEDMVNSVVMADGCTDQGCESIYVATAGSIEISTWETDVEGGAFEATLTGLELAEVDSNYAFIDGGKTWCVDSLEISATVNLAVRYPDPVQCDNQGFTAAADTLTADTSGDGGPLFVEEANAAELPHDVLSLRIFPSYDGAATTEGTYELTDYNYASCANCLLIFTDCGEDTTCEPRTFIAGEGTLDITSAGTVDGAFTVGEQFTATLTNATLVEVVINQSLETEIVEDGEGWCIDSYTWDVTIEQTPSQ